LLVGDLEIADHTKWWAEDRNILIYFLSSRRDQIYFVTQAPQAEWR
jgi:6-hydroxynicotinate 3-monooxygenase